MTQPHIEELNRVMDRVETTGKDLSGWMSIVEERSNRLYQQVQFVEVPLEILEARQGKRLKVHVKGWNKGCVFVYINTVNGTHFLKTPVGNKKYTTTNKLLFTRKSLRETQMKFPELMNDL